MKIGDRLFYTERVSPYEAEILDVIKYYNNGDIDIRYLIRYKDVDGMKTKEVDESTLTDDLYCFAEKLCIMADDIYDGNFYKIDLAELVKGTADIYKTSEKEGDFYKFRYISEDGVSFSREVRRNEIYKDAKELYENRFKKLEGRWIWKKK